MVDIRQLAKEEAVKNLIDKLIFGLIAAFIVFGVQKCSDENTRLQIEKEAILKLESAFILNEAKTLQSSFSEYISVVTKSVSLGLPPTDKNTLALLSLRIKIESSLEILSVYSDELKGDTDGLITDIISLNDAIRSFNISNTEEYQKKIKNLKVNYGSLLASIKVAAIKALSEENN